MSVNATRGRRHSASLLGDQNSFKVTQRPFYASSDYFSNVGQIAVTDVAKFVLAQVGIYFAYHNDQLRQNQEGLLQVFLGDTAFTGLTQLKAEYQKGHDDTDACDEAYASLIEQTTVDTISAECFLEFSNVFLLTVPNESLRDLNNKTQLILPARVKLLNTDGNLRKRKRDRYELKSEEIKQVVHHNLRDLHEAAGKDTFDILLIAQSGYNAISQIAAQKGLAGDWNDGASVKSSGCCCNVQ